MQRVKEYLNYFDVFLSVAHLLAIVTMLPFNFGERFWILENKDVLKSIWIFSAGARKEQLSCHNSVTKLSHKHQDFKDVFNQNIDGIPMFRKHQNSTEIGLLAYFWR